MALKSLAEKAQSLVANSAWQDIYRKYVQWKGYAIAHPQLHMQLCAAFC